MPNSFTVRGTIRCVLEGPRSGWDYPGGSRVSWVRCGQGPPGTCAVVHGVMLTDWDQQFEVVISWY